MFEDTFHVPRRRGQISLSDRECDPMFPFGEGKYRSQAGNVIPWYPSRVKLTSIVGYKVKKNKNKKNKTKKNE